MKLKKKTKSKGRRATVSVSPDITSVTVGQSVKQSANYSSAECHYSVTANTNAERVEDDIDAMVGIVETQLGKKLKEQHELLRAMSK